LLADHPGLFPARRSDAPDRPTGPNRRSVYAGTFRSIPRDAGSPRRARVCHTPRSRRTANSLRPTSTG